VKALSFAARSLLRQGGRSALGVLGVAAVGALLFDMLLLSRGLVVSFRELLSGFGFDARVMATDSLMGPQLKDVGATVAALMRLPEVAEAVPLRLGRGQVDVARTPRKDVSVVGANPGRRSQWRVVAGRGLAAGEEAAEREALVNQTLARELQLAPGASFAMRGPCGGEGAVAPDVRFKVVGIASFPFEESGERVVGTTLQAFARNCPAASRDRANLILIASHEGDGPDAAVAAIKRVRPDLHAFTNDQLVARFQRVEFSYFRQISAVLATLTLFFGALLITVLLTVSVNQRLAEIAALRALGFSRRRVLADVLCQSLLLVGTGGLLALPLGLLLARWLDHILKEMPGIPTDLHFFVYEPRALYLHVALLGAAALGAALYPMRLVARLPIAATLRSEAVT
jgi:putative ABC transport system permease protein